MQIQRDHERALAREERRRTSVASFHQRRQTVHDQMLAALADFRHELIEGNLDSQVALKHTQVYLAYLRLTAVDPGETSGAAADALEHYWGLRGGNLDENDRVVVDADAMLLRYATSLSAHLYAPDEDEEPD